MAVYFGISFVMFTKMNKSSLQIFPLLLKLEDLEGKLFGDKMGLLLHYRLLSFMFLKNINFCSPLSSSLMKRQIISEVHVESS